MNLIFRRRWKWERKNLFHFWSLISSWAFVGFNRRLEQAKEFHETLININHQMNFMLELISLPLWLSFNLSAGFWWKPHEFCGEIFPFQSTFFHFIFILKVSLIRDFKIASISFIALAGDNEREHQITIEFILPKKARNFSCCQTFPISCFSWTEIHKSYRNHSNCVTF